MRIFFYFVIFGAVGLIALLGLIIITAFTEWQQKREFATAIEREREKRNNVWKEAKAVSDMVGLYMHIVCKHGADSEEAKAFRFGADSRMVKELLGDSEAMLAFNQQCDIIDDTYRKSRPQ